MTEEGKFKKQGKSLQSRADVRLFTYLSALGQGMSFRLTRTAVVELVDRVKVFDKKHIEVVFQFDDCYQSMMKQIETTGCAVSVETAGRKEVV